MITANDAASVGSILRKRLGGFWTFVFDQPELAKRLMQGLGELTVQQQSDEALCAAASDRRTVSDARNVRWLQVQFTEATRNTGSAAAAAINDADPISVGAVQAAPYNRLQTPEVGAAAQFEDAIAYPAEGVKYAGAVIVDNPFNPTLWYWRGIDFELRQDTLFFYRGRDPMVDAPAQLGPGNVRTVTLFMADAGVESHLVGQMLDIFRSGLGIEVGAAAALNAAWDMYNMGATPATLRRFVGTMLGHPVTGFTRETVVDVTSAHVITDKAVYAVPAGATVRADVRAGGELQPGSVLTTSVLVFAPSPGSAHLDTQGHYAMRDSMPGIFLPPATLGLKHGLEFQWEEQPLMRVRNAAGEITYRFNINGCQEAVTAFWERFDALNTEAERAAVLRDYITGPGVFVCGSISPARFVLDAVLSGAWLWVVVDRQVGSLAPLGRVLGHVAPVWLQLAVVQRSTKHDAYSLGDAGGNIRTDTGAYFVEHTGAGVLRSRRLRYRERVTHRLVPV